jgi:hypothetical protein
MTETSDDDSVVVFAGTQTRVEALTTMLQARGITAIPTPGHRVEGGTAVIEAVIRVPAAQADDARALIADVDSGAAEKR